MIVPLRRLGFRFLFITLLLLAGAFALLIARQSFVFAQGEPTEDPFATVNARVTELAQTPNLQQTADAATAKAEAETATAQAPDPFATVNARATINATMFPSATPPPTETPAAPSVQTLSIEPGEGPSGTTYVVTGVGLEAGKAYRLVVSYRDQNQTLLDGPISADDAGQVIVPLTSEQTDPPGNYDVYLYDGETIIGVGAFSITVAELSIDAAIGELTSGQFVQGALNFDVAVDIYTFAGSAGDIVTIDMRSTDFDPFLLLAGENGVVLTRNDNGGGGQNARITTFELTSDGTYIVGATSRTAAESGYRQTANGSYTLSVNFARFAADGAMTSGETIVGELSTNVQTTEYTFTGQSGQNVSIDLGSEDFDPLLRLRAPNGREIATDDDGGPGLYANLSLSLPESGDYTIVVDGNRGFTGQRVISGRFALTLNIEGAQVVAQPTDAPSTPVAQAGGSTGTITYGNSVSDELTGDVQQAIYSFDGRAGDIITIALDSEDFDVTVILLNAAGDELTRDDDGGPGLNALISGYTLPADGQYQIVVDGYRGVQGDRQLLGVFTITLNSGADVTQATAAPTAAPTSAAPTSAAPSATPAPGLPTTTPLPAPSLPPSEPGTIVSGETISGAFTVDTQEASYTFTGNAGEAVSITLLAEGFDPLLRLLDSTGTELTSDDDGGGGLNARISNYILPLTDIYTIVVDAYRGPDGQRTVAGTFNLSLTVSPAGVVMATPTPAPAEPTGTPAPGEPTVPPQDTPPSEPSETTPTPTAMTPPTVPPFAAPTLRPGAIPTPMPLGFDQVLHATFVGTADEVITFRFGAVAGDIVTISTESDGLIDTSMTLIAPNGETLASDDDGGSSFDPEIQGLKLPDTGEYVVVLMPFNPGDRGNVQLSLKLLSPAMLDAGSQIIQINPKNPSQALLFYGNEGETMRLTIRSISQVIGTPIFIVTQGDRILASNPVGQNMRLSFDFLVEDDGPVAVTVTGGEDGSAVLEVNVERLP